MGFLVFMKKGPLFLPGVMWAKSWRLFMKKGSLFLPGVMWAKSWRFASLRFMWITRAPFQGQNPLLRSNTGFGCSHFELFSRFKPVPFCPHFPRAAVAERMNSILVGVPSIEKDYIPIRFYIQSIVLLGSASEETLLG